MSNKYGKAGWDHRREQLGRIADREQGAMNHYQSWEEFDAAIWPGRGDDDTNDRNWRDGDANDRVCGATSPAPGRVAARTEERHDD